MVDPELTKTLYSYLPSERLVVAVDPKDTSNTPPPALLKPTVNVADGVVVAATPALYCS